MRIEPILYLKYCFLFISKHIIPTCDLFTEKVDLTSDVENGINMQCWLNC